MRAATEPGRGRGQALARRWLWGWAAFTLLIVVYPIFPPAGLSPNRDSGVFLYTGRALLEGRLPYVEVWDHKPPLIHALNALGQSFGIELWGTWALELVLLGLGVVLLAGVLEAAFGRQAAVVGLAALFVALAVTFKGNLPEEYGLPLQCASLALVLRAQRKDAPRRRQQLAGIGLLGGMAVLLKPTLVATWLAIALVLVGSPGRRGRRGAASDLLVLAGAGAVPLAAAAAILVASDVWPAFWDAVVRYNWIYASGADRVARLGESLTRLGGVGTVVLVALGLAYLAGLVGFVSGKGREEATPGVRLLSAFAVVNLPLESLLAAGTGRIYLQYLTPFLPAGAILASWLASRLRTPTAATILRGVASLAMPAALVGVCLVSTAKLRAREAEAEQVLEAVGALRELAADGQPVLVWGAETQVYVLADRWAPTRYVYLYPLLTRGYTSDADVSQFLEQLKASPPAAIVDTSATNAVIPPLEAAERLAWQPSDAEYQAPESLQAVLDWINHDYELASTVGSWRILRPRLR